MPAAACCPQLPAPPVYAKVNPADAPVITLAVSSTSLPITTVEDLADTRIAQKISQLVRRRPGQHFRRPASGRAGAGQSAAAGVLWPEYRRSAHHHLQQQFQRAQGQLRRRRRSPTPSTPTTSCRAPPTTPTSWWPTRTARRCICRDVATVVQGAREQQAVELGQQDARPS